MFIRLLGSFAVLEEVLFLFIPDILAQKDFLRLAAFEPFLSLEGFVDSGNSGSLIDLISINSGYNFTIKVDPKQQCPKSLAAPINAGTIPINQEDEALRYTFIGAKLNDFGYNSAIGDNKVFSASFNVEVDPDNLTEGFFISGVYGMEKVEDFILLEGSASGNNQNGFYLQ